MKKLSQTKMEKEEKGKKTKCPQCPNKFSNAGNLRRHLNKIHSVSVAECKAMALKSTSRRCKHCKIFRSNLAKHLNHCGQRPGARLAELEEVQDIENDPDEDLPGLEPGGVLFMGRWDRWMAGDTLGLADTTKKLYRRKLKHIIEELEKKTEDFFFDSLLYPLQTSVVFPSLAAYLEDCTTQGDRLVAIKVYKYIGSLVLLEFSKSSIADKKYSITEKTNFRRDVLAQVQENTDKLKGLNRDVAKKTAVKIAKRQNDPEDLAYNPTRMREIFNLLMAHRDLREIKEDLLNLNSYMICKKYDEKLLRDYLINQLLIGGNGSRPSAVARMKIGETLNATAAEDGTKVVSVQDHKTAVGYGACPIAFCEEGLFDATLAYLKAFRDENDTEGFLFASANGTEPDTRTSVAWLKKTFLQNHLTEKELETLTPKVY